jgi:hypothetical protein
MEIISTSAFLKNISRLKVTAEDLRALEAEIVANPQAGDVIKGLKGIRKIRFSYGGKGKRGGGRCVDSCRSNLSVTGLRKIPTDGPVGKTAKRVTGIY